jgi:ABC-type transport system involved in multi-copper enzyme maturation permease subunit
VTGSSPLGVLFRKELLELSRNRAALLPVALMTLVVLAFPFGIVVVIPAITGQALSRDSDFVRVSTVVDPRGELAAEARIQLFLLQQFLTLFLLTPITGAMSFAAHSVVGEKQARTLEPLLATPVSTFTLLVAKVLGALVPPLAFGCAGLALYFGGIGLFAEPGVLEAMVNARTIVLVLVVGPAAALVSLQTAILISSRVNDARTAQQFAVLIVVPLTVLLVAQFTGRLWLATVQLALIAAGLLVVWLLLVVCSVAVFDRESILTRWR